MHRIFTVTLEFDSVFVPCLIGRNHGSERFWDLQIVLPLVGMGKQSCDQVYL